MSTWCPVVLYWRVHVLSFQVLAPDVQRQLHYAHQGDEKCKLRAEGLVFWANINCDIEELVKIYPPCQRHQKLNVKELLLPHDMPQKPWHTWGSDTFLGDNANYLVVVDYYGKFPVLKRISNFQSSRVVAHLKSVSKEHGILGKLVTDDNGPQWASAAFHELSHKLQIYSSYIQPAVSSVQWSEWEDCASCERSSAQVHRIRPGYSFRYALSLQNPT